MPTTRAGVAVALSGLIILGCTGCKSSQSSGPAHAIYMVGGSSTNILVTLTRPGGVAWQTQGDLTGKTFDYEFTTGDKVVILVNNEDGQGNVSCDIVTANGSLGSNTGIDSATCQGVV